MKTQTAFVYWIHLPNHTDPLTEGYIGVSRDVDFRINSHLTEIKNNTHTNNHLIHAVNKYGWDNLVKEVLITDDEEMCYIKETEMRPTKSIGWNIAPGGHRGPGRKKGQSISKESIEKAKETIRLRNERILSGDANESDLLFLERKKERNLLSQKKILEKKQTKVKEKELKKQQKLKEKEAIHLEKNRNRTKGVILTKQPSRPLCENCKISLAKSNGTSKHGFKKWHKYCASCAKSAYNSKFGYLLHKKNKCEKCGFVPEDKCQLDVIYKDDNKKNKEKSNLKTLCSNCNRLHTKKMKEKKKSILDITVDTDYTL